MPERNCKGCTRQEEWGCEAKRWRTPAEGERDTEANWVKPSALPTTIQGEEVYFCPRQPLREDPRTWGRLLMFYQMFKSGHLPDAGSIVDQSNVMIETLRLMEEENLNCDQVLQDREKAKKARNAKALRGAQGRKRQA